MATLKEIAESLRARLNEISAFPEVIIPNSLKTEIGDLILNRNNTKTSFNENSFYVETSPKHYAIIPNQYFYLAVECYDLVVKVRCLFDFFDKVFRPNDELKRKINLIQDKISKNEYIDVKSELEDIDFSLYSNVTVEDFSYLISNLKDSKKFGNLEKNSLRTSEDLLGAYVLNIVPLTTAASGYFGTLVYALSSDFTVYKKLCDSIKFTYAENKDLDDSSSYISNFSQIIYYGVPGSGKSHKIDEETKDLPEDQKMRVVFHPEYTNSDFVGQILPNNTDGTVSYKFKPGPFTKILRRAYLNPSKKYYLIIEEINRGNAAAIFGEVFQLLDRIADNNSETAGGYSYGNGWSRYSIENDFMNWYIRENLYTDINHKLQNEDDGIAKKSEDESQKSIEIGNLHFSALTGIRLPPNLSLYATMNTSDQNVFTLDNAFQRRWDMQLVKNECTDDNQMKATITVKDQKITWGDFQQTINSVIGEKSNEGGLSSMEDKRLGCWFVKAKDKEIKADDFANKVLKYLWDDAFKFYHQEIFGGVKNFEELQNAFLKEKGFAVFSDACGLKIEKTSDGHAEVDSASENIDSESSSE